MNNYKQILEAVNRGIKFALSDLEDDEELSSIGQQKQGQIVNNNSTKNLLKWKQLIIKLENDKLTKQDIEELARISKLLNIKYTVNSTSELDNIVDYIDNIDHYANLNWIDTSKLRNMSCLFYKTKFNGDISEWDVSNVINMESMFQNSPFNQDISNWDVNKVKYTSLIFYNCPIIEEFKPKIPW